MKKLLPLIVLITYLTTNAQCPTITVPSTLALTTCTGLGQQITATANYSANIISWWQAPTNIQLASVGTATSTALINHIGTYTVNFKDVVSNCTTSSLVVVTTTLSKPNFDLFVQNWTTCVNSTNTIGLINGSTFPIPGGAISYSLVNPMTSSVITLPIGSLSTISIYTPNTCGNYIPIVKDNVSFCISSFDVTINCSTATPSPIQIVGNTSLCAGSNLNLTATGAVNYNWSGPFGSATGPTLSVPMAFTNTPGAWNVILNTIDANTCYSTVPLSVNVTTNCAIVWPGDADRDGAVTTSDVLELGLWAGSTGPARTATSIAWAGQMASAWTGTISTGWNRAHADCNGDGVVDGLDNAAVAANFSLTHTFKSAQSSAVPEIKLVPQYSVAYGGVWNKADVVLGDVGSLLTLYGVAFDISYNQLQVETDSVKLLYVPSFMKLNNTTIDFAKNQFNNGKTYCATVRTDQMDMIASGKIAEFWYKVKAGLPQTAVMNLSVSDGQRVLKNGFKFTLATQAPLTLPVDNNALGLSALRKAASVTMYPNPASGNVTLIAEAGMYVKYCVSDLSGRRLAVGDFENTTNLNLSEFADGIYLVTLEANGERTDFKLAVQK